MILSLFSASIQLHEPRLEVCCAKNTAITRLANREYDIVYDRYKRKRYQTTRESQHTGPFANEISAANSVSVQAQNGLPLQ
jgi:hypothetical protein